VTFLTHICCRITTKELLQRVHVVFGKESDLFDKFKMFLSPAAKRAAGIESSDGASSHAAPAAHRPTPTAPTLTASGSIPAPSAAAAAPPRTMESAEFQQSAQQFVLTIKVSCLIFILFSFCVVTVLEMVME
jgi:hypothetical protein